MPRTFIALVAMLLCGAWTAAGFAQEVVGGDKTRIKIEWKRSTRQLSRNQFCSQKLCAGAL